MFDDPDLQAMQRQLTDDPDDWDTRKVMADRMEELGMDTRGIRYRIKHKKRPLGKDDDWNWWDAHTVGSQCDTSSDIPQCYFKIMVSHIDEPFFTCKVFLSLYDAESEFDRAYHKVKDKRKRLVT